MTLNIGDKAPELGIKSQFGKTVTLGDYSGQWLLVWWIPSTMAEMTPACCDSIAKGLGAAVAEHPQINVVGLSFDTPTQMSQFASRGAIQFPLLADTDKTVGEKYGVVREGEWDCFPKKMAFLVNPGGNVEKIYRNIDPDFFVDEVVHDLDALDVVSDNKPSLFRRLIGK